MNGRAGSRRHGVWRVPLRATTCHTAPTLVLLPTQELVLVHLVTLVLVLLPTLELDPRFWRVSHISTTQHYYSDCIGTGTGCGTVTGNVCSTVSGADAGTGTSILEYISSTSYCARVF